MKRKDPLSPRERSQQMSRIRGSANASTEVVVEARLKQLRLTAYEKHPSDVIGRPDFFFRAARLAIFVDGCFWHGCARCARRTPRNNRSFWREKIVANRKRDQRVRRGANRVGIRVVRLWEHELRNDAWTSRVSRALARSHCDRGSNDHHPRAQRPQGQRAWTAWVTYHKIPGVHDLQTTASAIGNAD